MRVLHEDNKSGCVKRKRGSGNDARPTHEGYQNEGVNAYKEHASGHRDILTHYRRINKMKKNTSRKLTAKQKENIAGFIGSLAFALVVTMILVHAMCF